MECEGYQGLSIMVGGTRSWMTRRNGLQEFTVYSRLDDDGVC